jgi:hypothetical protein
MSNILERNLYVGPDAAVVPAGVEAMMIEYDRKVIHYEVAEDYTPQ